MPHLSRRSAYRRFYPRNANARQPGTVRKGGSDSPWWHRSGQTGKEQPQNVHGPRAGVEEGVNSGIYCGVRRHEGSLSRFCAGRWLHWCVMPRVLRGRGAPRSQGTVLRGWPQSCGARWLPLSDEAGEGFGVVDQELEDVEERELER